MVQIIHRMGRIGERIKFMEKILHIAEQIVAEIEGTKHVDVLVKTALGLTKSTKVSVGSSLIRIETNNLIPGDVYQKCRKTLCFSYRDIRHVHRISASN